MEEELQKQIDDIKKSIGIDHQHNGFDMTKVEWININTKKLFIHHTIVTGATAGNYGTFYIVPFPCVLMGFKEVHQVLGTDVGAVTVTLERLTGTQAPDAGTEMLLTPLSLKTTINTVQSGVMSIPASRSLATNDRLCLKDAGTLTAVSNVCVIIELKII